MTGQSTQVWNLFNSNVYYAQIFIGLVSLGVDLDIGDPLYHLHSLGSPSKYCMLVVQPRLFKKKKANKTSHHNRNEMH